jgi:hypothetical protein
MDSKQARRRAEDYMGNWGSIGIDEGGGREEDERTGIGEDGITPGNTRANVWVYGLGGVVRETAMGCPRSFVCAQGGAQPVIISSPWGSGDRRSEGIEEVLEKGMETMGGNTAILWRVPQQARREMEQESEGVERVSGTWREHRGWWPPVLLQVLARARDRLLKREQDTMRRCKGRLQAGGGRDETKGNLWRGEPMGDSRTDL